MIFQTPGQLLLKRAVVFLVALYLMDMQEFHSDSAKQNVKMNYQSIAEDKAMSPKCLLIPI